MGGIWSTHLNEREGGSASPWGFGGTVAWGLVALVACLAAQVIVFLAFVIGTGGRVLYGRRLYESAEERKVVYEWGIEFLLANSLFISVSTIAGALAGTAVLLVRRKFAMRDYLSLRWPGLRTLTLWTLAGAGFWAAFNALALLLDRPLFMVNVDVTVGTTVLLFVAAVVFVPFFEETLFRGFLFRGWSPSRLRVWGTIALTAALWAVLYRQYDPVEVGGVFLYGILLGTARAHDFVEIGALFLYGILLGAARQRTGTLIVPLVLHALAIAAAYISGFWVCVRLLVHQGLDCRIPV